VQENNGHTIYDLVSNNSKQQQQQATQAIPAFAILSSFNFISSTIRRREEVCFDELCYAIMHESAVCW